MEDSKKKERLPNNDYEPDFFIWGLKYQAGGLTALFGVGLLFGIINAALNNRKEQQDDNGQTEGVLRANICNCK